MLTLQVRDSMLQLFPSLLAQKNVTCGQYMPPLIAYRRRSVLQHADATSSPPHAPTSSGMTPASASAGDSTRTATTRCSAAARPRLLLP
jgi:hypothetical protein